MMNDQFFTIFDTAIGPCGIAWGPAGIAFLQLPMTNENQTRARLLRSLPGVREAAPTTDVQETIDAITSLLQGEPVDLSHVKLDMRSVPPFHCKVYEVARAIPVGATLSYGDIAERAGAPGSARAVGQALGRNPFPILVPCHRVLAARGKIGGFSANGGTSTKRRLLSIERAMLSLFT